MDVYKSPKTYVRPHITPNLTQPLHLHTKENIITLSLHDPRDMTIGNKPDNLHPSESADSSKLFICPK